MNYNFYIVLSLYLYVCCCVCCVFRSYPIYLIPRLPKVLWVCLIIIFTFFYIYSCTGDMLSIQESWRYQRNYQKLSIEEGQTKNDQKKHTVHRKLKIERYQPQIKTGDEPRCSRRIIVTSGIRFVNLVTNPVISYE